MNGVQDVSINFSDEVGTWMAGVPAEMSFNSGMEDKVKLFNAKKVYRIVTVQQPPFMRWNETTRKILNFPEKKLNVRCFMNC